MVTIRNLAMQDFDRMWVGFDQLRSRMDGWQLESFDKAYKQKVETGLSPIKEQKIQNTETKKLSL